MGLLERVQARDGARGLNGYTAAGCGRGRGLWGGSRSGAGRLRFSKISEVPSRGGRVKFNPVASLMVVLQRNVLSNCGTPWCAVTSLERLDDGSGI